MKRTVYARLLFALAVAIALVTSLALAGCASSTQSTSQEGTPAQQPAEQATSTQEGTQLYTPTYKPNGKEVAVFKTSQGVIKVELFGKEAPITVGSFIELAQKGFYDNTKFHRYEPGFVVQGGDPQTKDLSAAEVSAAVTSGTPPLGTGGPGYQIAAEFDPAKNPHKHELGALGLARSQDPNSGGSQFYFALQPLPMLDGQYTVFGKVIEGLDAMKKLRIGDTINSITIDNANK